MKLEKRRYDDVVILKFSGEFDSANLGTFSPRLDAMIDKGDRQIVLELFALRFVNSTALGYLIKTAKRIKEVGGEMVIARPSKFVQKTLATLGLEATFLAFQTVEDAIVHFKKGETVGTIDLSKTETDESLTGSVPLLFRKDDDRNLPPNQVGRVVQLYEDGLLFRYEPAPSKGTVDPVASELVMGARMKVKFRQPFAVKDHYFEMSGTITEVKKGAVDGAADALTVRLRYDRIRDDDRKHLQQLVRDLETWKVK